MIRQTSTLLTVATLFLTGCSAYHQQTSSTSIATDGENDVAKSREDVKRLVDTVDPWLETSFNNVPYLFVAKVLPTYGSSKIELHGWVFRQHSEQWERVFLVRTNGVGGIELSVDQESGIFSAKGTANNKFRNKKVFEFDLNATEA